MDHFHSRMNLKFNELCKPEKKIINEVWEHITEFVQWPAKAILLWEGCVRVRYHKYPNEVKKKLKPQGNSNRFTFKRTCNNVPFCLLGEEVRSGHLTLSKNGIFIMFMTESSHGQMVEKRFMLCRMVSTSHNLLVLWQYILSLKHLQMNIYANRF